MTRIGPLLALCVGIASGGWAAEMTLVDGFDGSPKLDWGLTQGKWQVRDGVYHASGTGQTYVQDAVFEDVTLEADCRIGQHAITADWVGLLLGCDARVGSTTGYLVYVRYSGEVELYCNGAILAAKPTSARASFDAGRFVRLGVAVRKKHFTIKLDGQTVLECDAPGYRLGNVGLASCDVEGDFDQVRIEGRALGGAITGEVLMLPSLEPVPGATVEIYNSTDAYSSLVTRETVADELGRFLFTDLPSGEKAYWLRATREGLGGTTGWFVSVNASSPSTVDLCLLRPPRHDVWIDSAAMARTNGFQPFAEPQCFGGSRAQVKETRSAATHPEWWAEFDFEAPREEDYVPYFAAGQYPQPHYWSDYWWSLDGSGPVRASASLTIDGPRYADRATMVWAHAAPQHLTAGKHTLRFLLRDPAPHGATGDAQPYWWAFDAAALAELPKLLPPGATNTSRPDLRWQAPPSADRFTVQFSQEPDFSTGTVTVAGVKGDRLKSERPLGDGVYFWRVKALPETDSPYRSAFTKPARFVVATGAPTVSEIKVVSRTPREAVITWRTDAPCVGEVRYGLSALEPQRSAAGPPEPTREHQVKLTGLQPMTYYYYWVAARDGEGREASSLRRGLATPRGVIEDRNSPFGMFGQSLTYAKQLGAAGARWYSDYWEWSVLEPARGTFNWEQAEQRMRRAEQAGVNLTVTFWGTPAWVRPSHPSRFTYGPDDLAAAREFFRAVAAHCRGRTDWWLPWIEPNVARDTTFGFPEGYWASRPHARSFTAYQQAAYEGAKRGDPECHVVGMETAGVDLDFIGQCYDEGAAESFDVMNVHYYAMTAPFEEQQPEQLFANLRALMAEYGDAEKPILCSEGGGASSGLPGTTEDTQADNLVRILVISVANNIDKLEWTFELDEKPYGSKRVDMIMWMGLFRFAEGVSPENPCGEPKPSYYAYKTMTENLRGTEYIGPMAVGTGIRAYRFAGPGKRVTVAWAEKGEADADLPVRDSRVTVVSRSGQAHAATASGRRLKLHLTGSPVFVREGAEAPTG